MQMVEPDRESVEARLRAGQIECETCRSGRLHPWGYARERPLRQNGETVRERPRRGLCDSPDCGVTHVLLPNTLLLRRADTVEVIWAAIEARYLGGKTPERIAAAVHTPLETVRGWLRRFRRRAHEICTAFVAWASVHEVGLGPIEAKDSGVLAALEAVGVAARVGERCFKGEGPMPLGCFAAAASCGRLLSPDWA